MMTNNPKNPEIYISVDIEASGPIPGKYSMLSIGACVVSQPKLSYYVELKPINNEFVPDALRVSNLSLDTLSRKGVPPRKAMSEFSKWILEVSAGHTPVFVGFNAVFDWSFINYYFHEYFGKNPFGFAGIDVKSFYMGLIGTLWSQTRSSHIMANFHPSQDQTHNALDDARSQGEIFKLLLDESNRRVGKSTL